MERRQFAKSLAAAGVLPLVMPAGSALSDRGGATEGDRPAGQDEKSVPELPAPVEPATLADFAELAKARLPQATFEYITTGSCDEVTLRENVEAFRRIRLMPPLLTGVASAELSTVVLGQKISLPVLLAPVAGQSLYHPEGGLAAARAAAAEGTIFTVSTSLGHSVEEVAAATDGPLWFQLYVPKDRVVTRKLVERAGDAGYRAIVVTVDLGEQKDADKRNRFALPREVLLKHLRDVGFAHLTDQASNEELQAFNLQAWKLALDWKFFDWLRSVTPLPLLIKGVLAPADARRAVASGLDGIIVSNHGGRRLDTVPASIDVLAEIVAEVNGRAELLLDGGIRRGTDVLKALALGAKAVLIGRPYAWALAADGENGVRTVLGILREELTSAMIASGCATVADVNASLIWKGPRVRD